MIRIELTEDKFLNDQEIESLKEAFRLNPIETLPLRLLLETGARGAELLDLQVSDLDHLNKTLYIHAKKGSKDRRIPLKNDTYRLLKRHCKSCDSLMFPFTTRTLRRLWDKYRLNSDKGVHALRHTFAVLLYKRHKDLMLVKTALGHRSIKNTYIYSDFVYQDEELRRLIA